jgi:hypothetical protein
MTLENALENVRREYYKACATEWVKDPLSYALYNVWKQADRERRKKETPDEPGLGNNGIV